MTSSLSRSPHQCPRCHVPLLLGTAADMSMHGCPSCGGIWLGSACAKRFSMALPKEALALAKKHAKSALGRVDTAPNIQCPVCNSDMQRTHIAAAQLEVDGCGAHGVWYDRNEMQSIARAMAKLNWQPSPETAAALGVAAVAIPAGVAVAQAEASRSKLTGVADHVDTAIDVVDAGIEVTDVVDGAGDLISGFFDLISSISID